MAGDAALVEESGADVNCEDQQGNSPLLCACLGGHLSVVAALVKASSKGYSLTTKANQEGTTPIMAAAWRGQLPLVQMLHKEPRTSLTTKDSLGRTAQDLAPTNGGTDT